MKPVHRQHTDSSGERLQALSEMSAALMREQDEHKLLDLIVHTAVELTGAQFGACTLRPINEQGEFLVPSEGTLFHLAAIVGVTPQQEEMFRHTPLGGKGVLTPIFHAGILVRIADMSQSEQTHDSYSLSALHQLPTLASGLHAPGIPTGHPTIRSFLGAPLLDINRNVRGGLLLGHSEPDQFTEDDEQILLGLSAQAAVAIENLRLYRAMQRRTQEIDSIFEHIADGITIMDQHAHILRANFCAQQLQRALQQSPHGRAALELLLYAPARNALQGNMPENAVVGFLNEQNELREFVINVSPLYSNTAHYVTRQSPHFTRDTPPEHTITGVVVVWHDVTEIRRLQLEQRLRAESDARRLFLQHILDQLPESVYLVRGIDARMVLANAAAKTVWKATWEPDQSMSDFLHKHHISIWSSSGRQLSLEQFMTIRAVRFHETIYQHQEILRYADGSTLPVMVNAIPLPSHILPPVLLSSTADSASDQEPLALLVHQDVSALKEAERVKDDFIGIAAHELRNPVAALHGFVHLLLKHGFPMQAEHQLAWQQEALENIDQATKRLMLLTDDLLDVTRLQAGRLELHREKMDVVSLVRRTVRRFQMSHKDHPFHIQTSCSFLVLDIDSQRIEQVIHNLLSNATKYSVPGSPITLSVWEEGERALISIQDQGIGIPLQEQGRIFGRFVRAENAQHQGIEGTGLGLYLCRELIERHGGHIWFHSVEGQGSTFSIALPSHTDDEQDDNVE